MNRRYGFDTVQALLGLTWGLFMTGVATRVLDVQTKPPPGWSSESARFWYAVAFVIYLGGFGFFLLRLEEEMGRASPRTHLRDAAGLAFWSLLVLSTPAAMSLFTVQAFQFDNVYLALMPTITMVVWYLLLMVRLFRGLRAANTAGEGGGRNEP